VKRLICYRIVRRIFLIKAWFFFRLKLRGMGSIPDSGPGIVVARHRSWLDPPCVGAACPRPIRFLIMGRLYDVAWLRWFYRLMGGIPLGKQRASSVAALREALRHLEGGGLIGIFPEGQVINSDTAGTIHPGAAMLAVRAGAPIIVLDINGTELAWPHGSRLPRPASVSVNFRELIEPPAGTGRDARAEVQRRIEAVLKSQPAEPVGVMG
jgi:1-acyl-sn-glycerol-3-phosphate acyltransferase